MPRRGNQVKPNDGNEDRDYEVESILRCQDRGDGMWYFIKWKGFDDSWNSWEPENLMNCPDKVKEFHKRMVEESVKHNEVTTKPLPTVKPKSKTSTLKHVPPAPKADDDIEVIQFVIVDKSQEIAVLFKINNQFELLPYRSVRGKEKFQVPLIKYFEQHLIFHETQSTTEVMIKL